MSFDWPQFSTPVTLPDGRSFTATFDSYDQRHEECYYRVTLGEGESASAFIAQVGTEWAGDDWSTPEFTAQLLDGIRRVAATGRSNTSYEGTGR